jgi:hypothetical protein
MLPGCMIIAGTGRDHGYGRQAPKSQTRRIGGLRLVASGRSFGYTPREERLDDPFQ